MENIDLIHYIEQARKSGMGDDKIREGLLQAGWRANDINEAMMKAPAVSASQTKPKATMSKSLAVIFTIVAIAVAGYFGGAYYMSKFQSFPLWPFEVSIPVPTFTPRPSPANLEAKLPSEVPADWQTYRNEEYGFEFKYPPGFEYEETRAEVVFNIIFFTSNREDFFDLTMLLNKNFEINTDTAEGKGALVTFPLKAYKEINIDGEKALFYTNENGINLIFNHGDHFYNIGSKDSMESTYNQILSTFRFTK